jgi:hypothetical protein
VGEGSGIGFATDPRGLHWAAIGGAALYFADRGNDEVQKLADASSFGSSFKLDIDEGAPDADSLHFLKPVDVSVDSAGYIYVVDTGNQRALRYAPDRTFVQRVDIEPDAFQRPLADPIAIAAANEEVYVADAALGEIVRYRRRK